MVSRKADNSKRRQIAKVSHDKRYGFAVAPLWKVIKGKPRVKCDTCGDSAVKILDGKPKCGNCAEQEST